MNDPYYIEEIKQMDVFEKMRVYWHYHVINNILENDFYCENLVVRNNKWVEYGIEKGRVKRFTLGKFVKHGTTYPLMTFEQFISTDNIKTIQRGVNWKEQGFAQQRMIQYNGIYDYYWKFKEEINQ
jgi:hypothetical protein